MNADTPDLRTKVEGLGELRKKLKSVQEQTAALKDNGSKVPNPALSL